MTNYEPPIGLHRELNPKLWHKGHLRPEVQLALLKIAKEFFDWLDVDTKIVDIVVSGSQANYNYSDHSDIDLHLIIPMDEIVCDEPIDALFDAKRKLWREKHTITIKGIPVEVYAENSNQPAVSSSYSILKDKWIDEPDTPVINYEEDEVRRLVNVWATVIDDAIKSKDLDKLKKTAQMLMIYRKKGLAKFGEFGVPNLVYKSLRNSRVIERLSNSISDIRDDELSLK